MQFSRWFRLFHFETCISPLFELSRCFGIISVGSMYLALREVFDRFRIISIWNRYFTFMWSFRDVLELFQCQTCISPLCEVFERLELFQFETCISPLCEVSRCHKYFYLKHVFHRYVKFEMFWDLFQFKNMYFTLMWSFRDFRTISIWNLYFTLCAVFEMV